MLIMAIFSQTLFADVPKNANCILERYQEYTDSAVSLFESINRSLRNNYPKEYELLKPCNDMIIRNAKYAQSVVDKWWDENPDRLFGYSPMLGELGAHFDRDRVLKVELELCQSKRESVTEEQWLRALSIQLQIQNSLSALNERFITLGKLKWSEIKCSK